MSSKFDWRAEDDTTWDEYLSGDTQDQQSNSQRKRPTWLIITGVALLFAAIGILGYLQLRRYVENTAASVEEDVLSSHALVKMAAQEDDIELLAPLLSGRDPQWTQDQITLLDMNLLLDRQPFGLTWKPQATADNISVTLSPDLQSAEVEYIESYGYGLNGQEGDIQLTQTAIYRLSETRWLLSPPNDDFWGSWISSSGRFVTLTFPERDSELGRRLASDLEATVGGACATLVLECGSNFQPLDVLLTPHLEAMIGINNAERFTQQGQLLLPTPTLLGKPANNASYRALHRGYATFILSHLIARQANWDCCAQSPFFKALIDVQLHQLAFQSWPITTEDYRSALRQVPELSAVSRLWDEQLTVAQLRERPEWWMLYTFIEYLVSEQENAPIIELERTLTETDFFDSWLERSGLSSNLNLVEEHWQEFIQQRIYETQDQPPIAWPEEGIALICNDGETGIANIYRYSPATNKWSVELGDRDFVVMNNLPGNQGLILTEQYLDVDQLRTTLWRDGQETPISFGEGFFFSAERSDPNGRYLVISSFQRNSIESGEFVFGLHLLELDNCNHESCPLLPIEGEPVWSPNGSQTLWTGPGFLNGFETEVQIYLGDAQLQNGQQIGIGFAPFWLDNENFAFLNNLSNTTLMAGSTSAPSPEQLLGTADLIPFIPEAETSDLLIFEAATDPTAPGLIYLTVSNRSAETNYLFTYNWQTNTIELLLTAEEATSDLAIHSFSPNHSQLILTSYAINQITTGRTYQEIILFDTESHETQSYSLIDTILMTSGHWSNDGRWLLFLGRRFLMLSAPEAGYDHLIPHQFDNCTGAVWTS